ncbi:Pycsar system effector family protein [Spongisporangium articulatum]|uniref:Pycsar system effector family protein n=1 Tax=Spongisporangium articulatum TaxID=3362603 RepID=A0ABW8APL6_9ACTN
MSDALDPDAQAAYVVRLLDEIRNETEKAEVKANRLLGSMITGAGLLVGLASTNPPAIEHGNWGVRGFSALAGVLVVAALATLARAVAPRLAPSHAGAHDYFNDFAAYEKPTQLLDVVADMSEQDVAERDARQVHALSRLLRRRYRQVNWSMRLLGLAAGSAVLAGICAAF